MNIKQDYYSIIIYKKKTYIFKKKCKLHPTWIKAAIGGKIIAKIVKKLKKDLHKIIINPFYIHSSK